MAEAGGHWSKSPGGNGPGGTVFVPQGSTLRQVTRKAAIAKLMANRRDPGSEVSRFRAEQARQKAWLADRQAKTAAALASSSARARKASKKNAKHGTIDPLAAIRRSGSNWTGD